MGEVRSYRDLRVWESSMELVEEVYRLSRAFPDDERFGLTAQIRRAVVSIPSNIAEGYGRQSRREYVRHLRIANGSLREVETQLVIATRLGYVDREAAKMGWDHLQDAGRMLAGLIRALRRKEHCSAPDSLTPTPDSLT